MMKMRRAAVVVVVMMIVAAAGCALYDSDPADDQVQQNNEDQQDDPNSEQPSDNNDDEDNQPNNDENNDGANDANQTSNNDANDDDPDTASRVEQLISGDEFERLDIRVYYVDGRQPRDGVADELADGIEQIIDKPEGVDVTMDAEIGETAPSEGWEFSDLQELTDDYAAGDVDDDTIVVQTLLVDGEYAESDSNVLGVAWGHEHAVLFMDQIEQSCQNASILGIDAEELCEHAELTVWRHEIGHVLGLVNNGAPMQTDHEDQDNQRHCKHDDCVMYWAYRNPGMMDRLGERLLDGEQSAPNFGDACLADLDAVQ